MESPHDLEAERSVLGAILLRNELLDSVAIEAVEFFRAAHKTLFLCFRALREQGTAIDLVTVCDALRRSDQLEAVGGPGYVASLIDGLPTSSNVEHYARIVREKAAARRLIAEAQRLAAEVSVDTSTIWSGSGERFEQTVAGIVRSAQRSAKGPIVSYLDTVQPEAVDWVWPGRIARGKYTLIAGEPGVGKSYLATDSAARISRGREWPDGAKAPRGRVLWLAAEDGISDTLRPRLDALGGDPAQIAILEAVRERDGSRRTLSLVRDLAALAQAVREVDPILIIVDPITAYLGQVDTHRDSDVRAALAPVLDLIAERRCALVAVGHLSKDSQRAALHRPGGSIAFVAAARVVLAVAPDLDDLKRRLLVPIKSNLSRPASVLAYRVTDMSMGSGLAWESVPVKDTDVEALFRPFTPADREERSDAEQVIRQLLEDETAWPLEARKAIEAGQAHGVPERTMRYAAKRIGIRIAKLGFNGKWVWHRPEAETDAAVPPKTLLVAPSAASCISSEEVANNNEAAKKSAFTRAREESTHERFV